MYIIIVIVKSLYVMIIIIINKHMSPKGKTGNCLALSRSVLQVTPTNVELCLVEINRRRVYFRGTRSSTEMLLGAREYYLDWS